jgi:hypothetical protein
MCAVSAPAPTEPPGAIDVERLMADLKARVADRRRMGEYDAKVLDLPFDAGLGPDASGVPHVRLRLETAYSSKPLVGKAITAAKRIQIRSFFHFLNDAVTQVNGALASMRAALDAETRAREALEDRVRELEAELDELHAAREASEHG